MTTRREILKSIGAGAAFLPALTAKAASTQAVCSHAPAGASAQLIPDTVVMNQFGERQRLYNDLVKGKIVTINFFYTSCDELCPILMGNLVKLHSMLGPRVGKDIFMYSLTLDADHDTPRVLRAYAERMGIGTGWQLLTSDASTMEVLRKQLKFTDPDPILDKLKSAHTGLLRYGNERLNRWAGCPGITRPEEILRRMSFLEPPRHPQGSPILPNPTVKRS